jgi:esterase/lipase superfamily enzyme
VFFGTDRQQTKLPTRVGFSSRRSQKLVLGEAIVTVPHRADRKVGVVNRPSWFERNILLVPEEGVPGKHFTIPDGGVVVYKSDIEFVVSMRQEIASQGNLKDHAVIFIHGFNVSFDDALYRAAQISFDLGTHEGAFGTTFVYSWPSAGEPHGYGYDEESASYSARHLRKFITLVSSESRARKIHVIAHSMGSVPLLTALTEMSLTEGKKSVIDQLILAAPDFDAKHFNSIASKIKQLTNAATIYVSNRDVAMDAARRFRGGAPRLGDSGYNRLTVVPNIDTIDVSSLSTDMFSLARSDYADRRELINDIGIILRKGERPPDTRNTNFKRVSDGEGCVYWRYAN